MKDAVATMGTILTPDVGGRDAVHVAVISATAIANLAPGQDVGFTNGEQAGTVEQPIGIVDPFLKAMVAPGQRFWLYIYPRTITGLSHKWSHPAFPDEGKDAVYNPPSQRLASEQWLRAFTAKADCPGYEQVMGMVATLADAYHLNFDDEYMHFDGVDAHGDIPDEFWVHAEIVLGRPIKVKPKYFSCSC